MYMNIDTICTLCPGIDFDACLDAICIVMCHNISIWNLEVLCILATRSEAILTGAPSWIILLPPEFSTLKLNFLNIPIVYIILTIFRYRTIQRKSYNFHSTGFTISYCRMLILISFNMRVSPNWQLATFLQYIPETAYNTISYLLKKVPYKNFY